MGGIVGQMEPFLEIQYLNDKLRELDKNADQLMDMMDEAYGNMHNYGKQANTLMKNISTNLSNISAAGSKLTATANELWYIYNNELTGLNQDLKTLNNDLSSQTDSDNENGSIHNVTISGGDITHDTESYRAALEKFGNNATVHIDNMTNATNDRSGGIADNLNTLNSEMEAATDNLSQLTKVLEEGTDQTADDVDSIVEQAKKLRTLISEIRDDLFRYEGITVADVSDEAASGEDNTPGAESGENAEIKPGEASEEESDEGYYDTTSFQQGKITLCENKGLIEADNNVGGIVGQISTEYDFDPEEDITLTGTESFEIEQTIKAVVRDSRSTGDIVGKKDCVGGGVGKAEFGAVISCESYGDISSTGGNNVGGIAGLSGYAIRNCYTMGSLSGRNNVGGIAGEGCDIFYSFAYNDLEVTGECAGAIAGKLDENGSLYGNYYVEGSIGGIDDIGYSDGATPLPYEEFCSKEGVPEEFLAFTVTFMADGEELASYKCAYGDSLSKEQIPDVPKKEGYYGSWPEFDCDNITGNKVLEAEYERWITSLASSQTDENGRAKLLVEGEFLPGEALQVIWEGDEISFTIGDDAKDNTDTYEGPVDVRVLNGDRDDTRVEVKTENGYMEVETVSLGSYLLFNMDAPGTFRVTTYEKGNMLKWYAAGVGIVLMIFLVILLLWIVKRNARRKSCEKSLAEEEK